MRSNHPKGVLKTLGIKQHKPAKVRSIRPVGGRINNHPDITGQRAGSNEPIHNPRIKRI
jgi:hypothetical protein